MARGINIRWWMGLVGVAGWLAASCAGAQDLAREQLAQMEVAMAEIQTVQTRFVQEKKMALFNQPLITHGSIWIEPPNRLLWRVESPISYALALDGTHLRQWDGETGKTTVMSLDGNPVFGVVSEQLNAWFGGRYGALIHDYEIEQRSALPATFVFVPKPSAPSAKMLQSVTVTFREDARYIAVIQMEERGGDRTTITFTDTQINLPLDAKAWEL